jgi:hypothetical protein
MIKLLNLGKVLKAFEPQLQERYRALGINVNRKILIRMEGGQSAGLVLEKKLSVLPQAPKGEVAELSDAECVRLLFGAGRPSESLRPKIQGKEILDLLFPLRWFWWRSDWV